MTSRLKGRRLLRKQEMPSKSVDGLDIAPRITSVCWFKGLLYKRGDVVGVVDEESGDVYFAVIRGFVQDQDFNYFSAVTWLLPKEPRTSVQTDTSFNKNSFILGPEDDNLYNVENFLHYGYWNEEMEQGEKETDFMLPSVKVDSDLFPSQQFPSST